MHNFEHLTIVNLARFGAKLGKVVFLTYVFDGNQKSGEESYGLDIDLLWCAKLGSRGTSLEKV
jgi:hypothetical protein